MIDTDKALSGLRRELAAQGKPTLPEVNGVPVIAEITIKYLATGQTATAYPTQDPELSLKMLGSAVVAVASALPKSSLIVPP